MSRKKWSPQHGKYYYYYSTKYTLNHTADIAAFIPAAIARGLHLTQKVTMPEGKLVSDTRAYAT